MDDLSSVKVQALNLDRVTEDTLLMRMDFFLLSKISDSENDDEIYRGISM